MPDDLTSTAETLPDGARSLLDRLLDEAEAQSPQPSRPLSAGSQSERDGGKTSLPSGDSPPLGNFSPSGDPPPLGNPFQGANPLGALLSNPAFLSALPTLMENLTPLFGSFGGAVGSTPTATHPHPIDRHTALLCAIKPYLSPHRRETAETVIRLCRVWDALERSGISLTGLLSSLGGGVSGPPEGTPEGRESNV